ncbi:MAG: polyphosphate kinase 1 [Treponema sp.]|jgi:polyphosphate kinase|nr:polyphosphate kinase 1 [Treponema sp.]
MEREAVFFNRDISWIDFNRRVLEEGLTPDLPPLDRFGFLVIVASNFDEFFMVRVAAIKRALRSGVGPRQDPAGLSPEAQLSKVGENVRDILRLQYECLRGEIFPALARGGLELVRPDSYSLSHMDYLETLFMREIYPALTPLRLGREDRIPSIDSLSLYAAFRLEPSEEGAGGLEEIPSSGDAIAIVQIPPTQGRIIWLPPKKGAAKEDASKGGASKGGAAKGGAAKEGPSKEGPSKEGVQWTLLDDVILTWGAYLFAGCTVRESMLFKINRDADFSVDEKRDEDFIEAMEEVLIRRDYSRPVRMVCSADSRFLRDELARRLELEPADVYALDGPLDLRSLGDLAGVRGFEHLRRKSPPLYPALGFSGDESLWDRISRGDVMLHLPYQSFDPVVRFFRDAAADPQVISIKTALYRTGGDSPIVRALEEAALNGKQVTALVELKARFDEELNISWANRLERAGVIVVYGLARLKVHAKISMVVRREPQGVKRYVHLSTGNYNHRTAKRYEDICLFTSREDIAFDAGLLFNMLTGYSAISSMRKLAIAPITLKDRLIELIDREAKRSSGENPGRIMAKMNALADPGVIRALYRASQAGVHIQLSVRGICMLVPGLPGLSENIRVVSIVDRFLEHSRIFSFANAGTEEFYLSSADWMPRNLERRIELMFPVLQADLRERIRAILEACFRDNRQSWLLTSSGRWIRQEPSAGDEPFRCQDYLLAQAAGEVESLRAPRQEFVVRRSPPSGD